MRIRLFILALSLYAVVADAHTFVPPEVVRLENVQIEGDIGTVYAGNGNRIYALYCAAKVAGCRWKMPVATRLITLTFVDDMTVKRNESKNIGIVPRDAKVGLYLLDPTGGGYEQGAIFTDGPIIYGTGMSDHDRRNAWAQFFLMMAQAADQQQGRKALGAKLARRCLPHQNFCTTTP
jgi:hypothetical protein